MAMTTHPCPVFFAQNSKLFARQVRAEAGLQVDDLREVLTPLVHHFFHLDLEQLLTQGR